MCRVRVWARDGDEWRLATTEVFPTRAAAEAYVVGCVDVEILPENEVPPRVAPSSEQSLRQSEER